jgi:hypothetical protein
MDHTDRDRRDDARNAILIEPRISRMSTDKRKILSLLSVPIREIRGLSSVFALFAPFAVKIRIYKRKISEFTPPGNLAW